MKEARTGHTPTDQEETATPREKRSESAQGTAGPTATMTSTKTAPGKTAEKPNLPPGQQQISFFVNPLPQPPAPSINNIDIELEAISEVVSNRCAGGGSDFFAGDEKGIEEYDEEFYAAEDEEGEMNITAALDETVLLEVGRLVNEEIRPEHGAQIKAKDVVPFVVLKFNPDRDRHWTVPTPAIFHDLINRVEGEIMEGDLECAACLLYTSPSPRDRQKSRMPSSA